MPYNSFPGQRTIYRVERLKAGDKNQRQELEMKLRDKAESWRWKPETKVRDKNSGTKLLWDKAESWRQKPETRVRDRTLRQSWKLEEIARDGKHGDNIMTSNLP